MLVASVVAVVVNLFFGMCFRHVSMDQCNDATAQPLPSFLFSSTAGKTEMPIADLEGITGKLKCKTFTGLSKNIIPGAWSLCQHLADCKDPQQIAKSWQSIFCMVGDVVQPSQAQFVIKWASE